jgi:ATP-binding cassette subfamily C protein
MTQPASTANAETLRLRIVQTTAKELEEKELEFSDREVWIGRAEDCDLVVPDTNMSRRHAQIAPLPDGRFMLRDNESANGVFVDGERVSEAVLWAGRRFRLGATTFEVLGVLGGENGPDAAPVAFDRTRAVEGIADLVAQFEHPQPLAELGEKVVVASNRPLLLSDPTSAWLVASGKIEIFTVAVAGGQPHGVRTHFLTVDAGQAFFGLNSEALGYDSGFLAVGKAGSELRRFDLDRLQLFCKAPAHRETIATLVEVWVQGLSRRLTEDLPAPPSAAVGLRPGEAQPIAVQKVAAAAGATVWVEMPAARFLFDSMSSVSYEAEGVLFPLAQGSWIELLSSEQPVKWTPSRTVDQIDDPRLWVGLDLFHRLLMECEFLNKRLAVVDEFNRLQRKAEQQEAAREAGIGAIESVLGGTRAWGSMTEGAAELGPIVQAANLVAAHLGIQVERPRGTVEDMSYEEALLAVATASRFRTRKVALVDDWWRRDQGPLLAQRETVKTPVALLPKGPRSYEIVDPVANTRRSLTEAEARTLEPFAHSFYRPFPEGVLRAKDLIRFGLRGLQRETREVALMGIAVGLLGTVTPTITGMVFDQAIPQAQGDFLLVLCLSIFLVSFSTAAFKVTQNVAMLRVQGKMDYSVQAAVWDRMIDLPMTFFRGYSAGDLADRAQGVDRIRSIVAGAGVSAILGSFTSLFNVGQMAMYSMPLAAVGFGLTLIYVLLTTACNYFQLRLQRNEFGRRGKITGLVLQLISGVGKLRVSGAEDHAFRVWATDFAAMRKVAFGVGRVDNFLKVFTSGFPVLSSIAIFYTMHFLKQAAQTKGEEFTLTTGDFLAFTAAYGIFSAAMQALGDASLSMLKMVPIYERLAPILQEQPETDRSKAAPPRLRGELEISHVSFRYSPDGPWILKDVSLKIRPGEFVALVGGSGSGKSTLMRLMLGFEKPEQGSVYYDGVDLSTLDVRRVREQLGVVLQQSRLLPADIFRNIVGASSRTIADAWDAAQKAGLADDIKAMPMGMHTYVSEGGGGFSGGQKQRLMIARSIVHRPRMIYLDEATSALDNKSQAIVTESMERLQATRVVIAHRLSTIMNADRIYYLNQGVIAEAGTYQELMEKNGLFAELGRRQLA